MIVGGVILWQNNTDPVNTDTLAVGRASFRPDQYAVMGSGNVYDLVVYNVALKDEGEYTCEIGGCCRQISTLVVNSEYMYISYIMITTILKWFLLKHELILKQMSFIILSKFLYYIC